MPADSTVRQEKEIKAVFLYNFTRFVDWPSHSLETGSAPFVIGILGTDPFGTVLDEVVRGEKSNDRPLVVKRFDRLEAVTNCHVLFVSRSETARLPAILKYLATQSVLSVSDIDGFAEAGGMIALVTANGKVRLKVNLDSARQAHLGISSKLLRPSQLVSSPKPNTSWKRVPGDNVPFARKKARIVRAFNLPHDSDAWKPGMYQ
ncbi:MAG: YfiR family protein [Opitutus sp.]